MPFRESDESRTVTVREGDEGYALVCLRSYRWLEAEVERLRMEVLKLERLAWLATHSEYAERIMDHFDKEMQR